MDAAERQVDVGAATAPLAYETPQTRAELRRERALARGQKFHAVAKLALAMSYIVLALTCWSVGIAVYAAARARSPYGLDDSAAHEVAAIAFLLSLATHVLCLIGLLAVGRRKLVAAAVAINVACDALLVTGVLT